MKQCIVVLFLERFIDGIAEVIDIIGDEVGQVGVFRVAPALFDGIQLRRVGRQPLEGEPGGMVLFEVSRRFAVGGQTIPDYDDMTPITAMQEFEQPDQLLRVDVFRGKMKIKRQTMTRGRNADETDR